MSVEIVLSFVALAAFLTFLPGASIALVVVNSLTHGWRGAFFTALGDISANTLQIIFSYLAISFVLGISPTAGPFLKTISFGILAIIVVRKLIYLSKGRFFESSQPKPYQRVKLFLEGFFLAGLNPQALVFFMAVFPTFIDFENDTGLQFALLGSIIVFFDLVAMMGYAVSAHLAKKLLHKKK